MNPVVAIGLFVGIPVGLALLIAVFVMVPRRYSGADRTDSDSAGLITSTAAVPNPAALPAVDSGRKEKAGGAHGSFEGAELGPLSTNARADVQRVVQLARDICGYEFAVFVGSLSSGRESALAMHAGMHDPRSAVLLVIDVDSETMDIVTGARVQRALDDRTCEFALLTLRSSLQVGDLAGGIRDAVMLLAEHSRAPRTLHLDEPV